MQALNLDLFTHAIYDFERTQYQVLDRLQKVRKAFSDNEIYPHLGELINLFSTLQTVMKRSEDLKESWPGKVKRIDLDAQEVVYEKPDLTQDEMQVIEDLIHWALPRLQAAIEEGSAIFEFVEDHSNLEEVGIVPSYVQEGYLMVPDREEGKVHILQYNLSIFTGAEERYRSLKTTHVRSIEQRTVSPSPQSIKLSLVEERRELPNPATYYFDTDLDFPFEPTMLPVAKRKLMQYLYTQGGVA